MLFRFIADAYRIRKLGKLIGFIYRRFEFIITNFFEPSSRRPTRKRGGKR